MAEFNYDKKREHERLAAAAIDSGELDQAYFHIKEAVKYTMVLAARCGGVLGQAYLANANGLLDVAEKLKARMGSAREGNAARSNLAKVSAAVSGGGEPSETGANQGKWRVASDTGVRMADVIGLDEAKDIVADALINPVKHPDIYKTLKVRPGTGLLLFGPPRTGKTMFGRAVAGELECAFIYVNCSELVDKYVGQTEKNITEVFNTARSYKRCVLFFDDCEKVMRKRGNQKVNSTGQFLTELDGFDKHEDCQVFVILATNRPWTVDGAILDSGRISAKAYVGLPNDVARANIISKALEGVELADDVNIERLVAMTDGYASGQICHRENGGGVCDVARTLAVRRWVERRGGEQEGSEAWNRVEPVTWADFEMAMKQVTPASRKHEEYIKKNLAFRDTGGAFREDDGGDE